MKVVGYIRVSTDEQERSGLGLEAQESKVRAYCELYGHELLGIEIDAASGKNLKREGLGRALVMLQHREADGLVVAKLDRLSRSVRDMGELLENYFSGLAALLVVAEQIDTSTAAGRMVLNLLTSVAQWERETIGERTRDAMRVKRERKELVGQVPFGYALAPDGVKLVPVLQEQSAIAEARRLRSIGMSLRAIAGTLHKNGHVSRNGRVFQATQIQRMLAA